jgi:hypothetical protein
MREREWAPPGWDRRQAIKGQDRRGPNKQGLLNRRDLLKPDRRAKPRWIELADRQDEEEAVRRWQKDGCRHPLNHYRNIFNQVMEGEAGAPRAPASLDT